MKKITFLFVAMMAMAFASCGGSKCDTPANEADSLAVEDTTVVLVDSLVETVADTVVVAE